MPRRPTPAKPAVAGGGMTPTQVKVRRRWWMMRVLFVLAVAMELTVFAITKPQAPLNNANTYSINLGTVPLVDTVSPVAESVGGASQTAILAGRVAFMQDLVALAKTDAALATVLNKWSVKMTDATGNQIFP